MYYLVVWWMTSMVGKKEAQALTPSVFVGQRASVHNTVQGATRMAQQLADEHPDDLVQIYSIDSERVTPYAWEPIHA